jgi:hypothetical protein
MQSHVFFINGFFEKALNDINTIISLEKVGYSLYQVGFNSGYF